MSKSWKRIVVLLVFVLVVAPVFADSLFSFHVLADGPLYKESAADPYAFNSHLTVIRATDQEKKPRTIRGVVVEYDTGSDSYQAFYKDMYYNDEALKVNKNMYLHMKGGTSLGFFRTSFEGYKWVPQIDFEVNLAGYINTIFNLFSKNEALAFDGSYFFGGSLRFADAVTVRVGMHHFSGHYGDEVLQDYYIYNGVDYSTKAYTGTDYYDEAGALIANYHSLYGGNESNQYYLIKPVEYVRDNSWLISLQADVLKGLRVYAETEIPMNPSWLRPVVHCPADYQNPISEEDRSTLIQRIGGDADGGEYLSPEQLQAQEELMRGSDESYRALRIHFGAEYRYEFSFCTAFAAFDFQLHQDGQTKHQIGAYSKDNPWETELTIGGGVEFPALSSDAHAIRVEAFYHTGRVPSVQWFYQRMDYISVGFSFY